MIQLSNAQHHHVARCRWQTRFDNEAEGFQLQEMLSHFSREIMPGILERALARYCPNGEVWRIDSLELNLGKIRYQDIGQHLPKIFADSLSQALQRLWQQLPTKAQWQIKHSVVADTMRLTAQASQLEFLRFYLRYGRVPWWFNPKADDWQGRGFSAQGLMSRQLAEAPEAVSQILRQVGQQLVVRQRIVAQYQQSTIRTMVKVLEPYHGESILQFADELTNPVYIEQLGLNKVEIERQRWLWILTHLLVERGSLFNTKMFVQSTLMQMASHFNLAYQQLLHQVLVASERYFELSQQAPQFIQVLKLLQKENDIETDTVESVLDYWSLFADALNSKQWPVADVLPWFDYLVQQDSVRMAKLLRAQQQKRATSSELADQIYHYFKPQQLAIVVKVLAPNDDDFILGHIEYSGKALIHQSRLKLSSQQTPNQLVWQLVLQYLLAKSSSFFDRKQLVQNTLVTIARRYDISYQQLVQLMCQSAASVNVQSELMMILLQLNQEQQSSIDDPTHDLQMLERYLVHGRGEANVRVMPLLYRHPQRLAKLLLRLARQLPAMLWLQRWLDLADRDGLLLHSAQYLWPVMTKGHQLLDWAKCRIHQLADKHYGPILVWRVLLFYLTNTAGKQQLLQSEQDIKRLAEDRLQLWLSQEYGVVNNKASNLSAQFSAIDSLSTKHQLLLFIVWLRQDNNDLSTNQLERLLTLVLHKLIHGFGDIFLSLLNQQHDRRTLIAKLVKLASKQSLPQGIKQQQLTKPLAKLNQWLDGLWPYAKGSEGMALTPFMSQWQQSIGRLIVPLPVSAAMLLQQMRSIIWQTLLAQPRSNIAFWQMLLVDLSGCVGLQFNALHQGLLALNVKFYSRQEGMAVNDISKEIAKEQSQDSVNQEKPPILDQTTSQLVLQPDESGKYLSHPRIAMLTEYWLLHGRAPIWLQIRNWSLGGLIADLYQYRPQLLLQILQNIKGRNSDSASWQTRLNQLLDFEQLLKLLLLQQPSIESVARQLMSFYQTICDLSLTRLDSRLTESTVKLQLWHEILSVLLSQTRHSSYQSLKPSRLLMRLIMLWSEQFGIALTAIKSQLKAQASELHFDADFAAVLSQSQDGESQDKSVIIAAVDSQATDDKSFEMPVDTSMPIAVTNAGLVILNGFIKRYLDFVGLLQDGEFAHQQAQLDAVHYLQFLVSGQQQTEEHHLLLNKLMVGLPIEVAATAGVEMSANHCEVAEGLINSVIQHWQAIGRSSIEGFRGNWLIRDGVLTEHDEYWHLLVEKRPYDLLLDRMPFGFSQVRLPWMEKAIVVDWPR